MAPHKDQTLHSHPETRLTQGELKSPVKQLQQHSRTLRTTAWKWKEDQLHFASIISPCRQRCSRPRGKAPARESSLAEKGKAPAQPASEAFLDSRFHFTPPKDQQSWDVERYSGTRKKSGGYQYEPCGRKLSVEEPRSFCPWKKAMASNSSHSPCRFYWIFTPWAFASHLSPSGLPSLLHPHQRPGSPGNRQASEAAEVQNARPWSLWWLSLTSTCLRLATPAVHLHTLAWFPAPASISVHMPMGKSVATGVSTKSRKPLWLLLGLDLALICHWPPFRVYLKLAVHLHSAHQVRSPAYTVTCIPVPRTRGCGYSFQCAWSRIQKEEGKLFANDIKKYQ